MSSFLQCYKNFNYYIEGSNGTNNCYIEGSNGTNILSRLKKTGNILAYFNIFYVKKNKLGIIKNKPA